MVGCGCDGAYAVIVMTVLEELSAPAEHFLRLTLHRLVLIVYVTLPEAHLPVVTDELKFATTTTLEPDRV